jgi:outer membrane lipoprotein-sorting protein
MMKLYCKRDKFLQELSPKTQIPRLKSKAGAQSRPWDSGLFINAIYFPMLRLISKPNFILFSFLLIFCLNVDAQKSPNQLLRGVYQKMMNVKDYSVEASIKADIPLIKILPVKAVVYFKQPDKFKIDSKGIAIMPRQGFSDVSKIIRDTNSYTAVFTGKEKIGTSLTQIISVLPLVDTGDLVLAKFWIDYARNLVLKSQLTTRSSGTMQIEYFYGTQIAYGLPDKMIFTVDVKKFKIPKVMASDVSSSGKVPKPGEKESKKGVILIDLKDYKINQGLKDAFFKLK